MDKTRNVMYAVIALIAIVLFIGWKQGVFTKKATA